MDPNAALARLRELQMADTFDGLDQWITRGGFLPKAWTHIA